jgi:exodeoxyribonuclease VII small subunit
MKDMSYENALKELQAILKDLQQEQVSIDDLQAKSDRAKELLDFCQEKLRDLNYKNIVEE